MQRRRLLEKTNKLMNADRLSETFKDMFEQESGCAFLAPLNVYAATGKALPRDIEEVLHRYELDIDTKDVFALWKEFLPYLGMKIESVLILTNSVQISGKPIEDNVRSAGWSDAKIENVSGTRNVKFSRKLSWMIIMFNEQKRSVHVTSAMRGGLNEGFVNVGGKEELEFYVDTGYSSIVAVGVSFTK